MCIRLYLTRLAKTLKSMHHFDESYIASRRRPHTCDAVMDLPMDISNIGDAVVVKLSDASLFQHVCQNEEDALDRLKDCPFAVPLIASCKCCTE